MRWMVLLVLVSAVVSAACSGAAQSETRTTPDGDGDASPSTALLTAENWRKAWEARDVAALSALYAHDLDVVVVEQGTAYAGWTAVEMYLSTTVGAVHEVHLTLEGATVTSLGPTGAVVSATLRREINDGVSTVTESGALTLVLRATTGDAWEIVAEHYSYPPSVD